VISAIVLCAAMLAAPDGGGGGNGGTLAAIPAVPFPGCQVSFSVTADPSTRVVLAGSLSSGPTTRRGVTLCLGSDLRLVASGRADAFGTFVARLRVPLKPPILGRDVFFQAVTRPSGAESFAPTNAVAIQIGAATPSFVDGTDRLVMTHRQTEALAAADIDGDGDLDVISAASLANSPEALQILVNLGGEQGGAEGVFVEETASRLRLDGIGDGFTDGLAVAVGDVDGDGSVDLLLGSDDNFGGALNRPNLLFRNRGDGTFEADPTFPGGSFETQSMVLADLDADGDLDAILGNGVERSFPEPNALLVNQGGAQGGLEGTFSIDPSFDPTPGETDGVVAADLDGDGAMDVFFARDGRNRLLRGVGSGGFEDASSLLPAIEDNSTAVRLADLDGDALVDLLVINTGDPSYWLRNGGALSFERRLLPAIGSTSFIRLGGDAADIDGDGDTDVVIAVHTLGTEPSGALLLNQGGLQQNEEGVFTWAPEAFGAAVRPFVATDVVLADFDGDRDTDIWLGSNGDVGGADDFRDQLLVNKSCGTEEP